MSLITDDEKVRSTSAEQEMNERAIGLGTRTASSVVWMASQTIVSRLISLVSQLVLAWVLSPKDFGQIGLVYTITAFATQLTNPGVDDVLLQRQRHLRKWMSAAFWLNLACGFGGAILTAIIGVVVVTLARHHGNAAYGNPNIMWMILILATGAPLNALSLVPVVILRSQMRFARIAGINFGEVMAQQTLSVLLAVLGFGAYSFVIPMPLVALVRGIILWVMVRPKIRMHLGVHRWPSLTAATGWVFGYRILSTATAQGDYMTLGILFADEVLVGHYYFAFILATQIIRVLSDNVAAVLMPALNTIHHDPERIGRAVERASRVLASIVVPVVTLQILLAGPTVRLLFAAKWRPAIPLVEWLSAGPLLYAAVWPMGAMIIACGRFKAGFFMWVINAIAFFALVVTFSWYWKATGTAMAVSIWSWVSAMLIAIWAYRSVSGVLVLVRTTMYPLISSAAGAASGAVVVCHMPHTKLCDLLTICIVAPTTGAIYFSVLRLLDPPAVQSVTNYFFAAFRPILRLLGIRAFPAA